MYITSPAKKTSRSISGAVFAIRDATKRVDLTLQFRINDLREQAQSLSVALRTVCQCMKRRKYRLY